MSVDHRSRNARIRREKMRARLIEAALFVSAMRGPDAASIDDVAGTAGVSRGSFYNYFFTLQELMRAAIHEMGSELIALVMAEIAPIRDPADRLAHGVLLLIEAARRYPLIGRFAARVAFSALQPGSITASALPPLLQEGMQTGRFLPLPLAEASDMAGATILASLARASQGEPVNGAAVVQGILRGLGIPDAEAATLAAARVTLPPIAADSLIARAEEVRLAQEMPR